MLKRLLPCVLIYTLFPTWTLTYALTRNEKVGIATISIMVGAGGVVLIKKIFDNHARPTEEIRIKHLSNGKWQEVNSSWKLSNLDIKRTKNIIINGERVNVDTAEQLEQALIERKFSEALAHEIAGKLNQRLLIDARHEAEAEFNLQPGVETVGGSDYEFIITNGEPATVRVNVYDAPIMDLVKKEKLNRVVNFSRAYFPTVEDTSLEEATMAETLVQEMP